MSAEWKYVEDGKLPQECETVEVSVEKLSEVTLAWYANGDKSWYRSNETVLDGPFPGVYAWRPYNAEPAPVRKGKRDESKSG